MNSLHEHPPISANNHQVITPSTSDPVSTVTGNMYHDATDVVIKGRGLDMAFTRTYNSGMAERDDTELPLSKGWTHSYNMRLTANDYTEKPNEDIAENSNEVVSSVTYMDERGGEVLYPVDGDGGTWTVGRPMGGFDTLALNTPSTGMHTITFRNGVKYVFEGIGGANMHTVGHTARLKRIEDPYGSQLAFTYDGSGRLINIGDNLGISGRTGLAFAYDANGRIETLSDWTGRTWTFGYANGKLASVTDPLDNTTQYTYNEDAHLLKEIILPEQRSGEQASTAFDYYENGRAFNYKNKLDQTETMDYDLYRKRTRVNDPRGFVREYTYDKNGALVKLTEPDKGILLFDNTVDGLRFQKTDALGFSTQYSYLQSHAISGEETSDTYGNVTLEKDQYENTVEYGYDFTLYDQIAYVKDKNGNERRYVYYQTDNFGIGAVRGKLEKAEAKIGGQWETLEQYTYYSDGNLKQKVQYIDKDNASKQQVTGYTYADNGLNLQQMIVTGQPEGDTYTLTWTYDDLGRKESETLTRRTSAVDPTPLALTTVYEYDALNRVIKTTDPLLNIRETVYDANGKVYQEKAHYRLPEGGYDVRTYATREYDAADRLVKETDIYGKQTAYAYDPSGNLIQVIDANGHISRYEYDAMNRKTATIDANGHRTQTVYDLAGHVVRVIDANGNAARYEYDALGRKTKDSSPLEYETRYEYDANGNPVKMIDANAMAGLQPKNSYNASVYTEYDEFNRPVRTVDAINGETLYTYDLLGNLTTVTDAKGQVTTFIYNGLGRLAGVIDPIHETPADKTVVFTYDEAGNVLTKTDRKGQVIRYTYDQANRLHLAEFLADSTSETRGFNIYGDLVTTGNGTATYTYTYDLKHRLTSKTDSRLNKSLAWEYDPAGNIIRKTDYQGEATEYLYDATNRLVSQRNPAYVQVSYHYDSAGRLLDRILSNKAKTSYQYDDDNRLIALSNTSAGEQLDTAATYTYDRVGNITSITDGSGTVSFTYDALYRLTAADYPGTDDDKAYTYDTVGNRLTQTDATETLHYLYNNSGNRLDEVRQGSVSGPIVFRCVYDDNGSRIEKHDAADALLQSCAYDQKSRMSTLTGSGPALTFQYDPNDYRIEKDDGTAANRYLMEGEHYEAIYDESGGIMAKFLRGAVVDEIVNGYYYDGQGEKTNYTFHHDHLRSVTALTGHNGSEIQTVAYGPFGEEMATTGTSPNILGYTGRELDSETGLYYYRARYYDPEIGRFLSEDPMGFKAGVNFYAYVHNNPINANDPDGLFNILVGGGVTAAAPTGAEASGGMVVNPGLFGQRADIGLFGSVGATAGVNVSADVFVGYVKGGIENVSGQTVNQNISFGPISVTVFQDAETGEVMGGTLGVGPGALPAGYSGAFDVTGTATIGDFIDWAMPSDSFSSGAAGGGFVIYPNKPNLNMIRSVYTK